MKSYMDMWLSAPPPIRTILEIMEWVIIIGVGLLVPTPKIPSSLLIKIIGIILILIGFWLHKLSHTVHNQAHQPKEKIKKLVTSDIYSKIRHPCYLEIILYYFGLFFLIGSLTMLLPILIFIYILYNSITGEEKYLKQKFGKEYEDYVRKVPWRFIPGLL